MPEEPTPDAAVEDDPLSSLSPSTVRSLIRQVRWFIDPYSGDYRTSPAVEHEDRFSTTVPHTYVSGRLVEEWPGKVARFREKWEKRPAEVRAAILALTYPHHDQGGH